MLAWLLQWDTQVFYLINTKWANGVFDVIMPIVTSARNWLLPVALGSIMLIWRGGRNGRITVLLICAAAATTDMVSYRILKPLVARPRPSHALADARVLTTRGGQFGFPSNHAGNIAAAMTITAAAYPPLRWGCVAVAALIAFSRVYVGVHYPLDVIAGVLLGATCALGWLWKQAEQRTLPQFLSAAWQQRLARRSRRM